MNHVAHLEFNVFQLYVCFQGTVTKPLVLCRIPIIYRIATGYMPLGSSMDINSKNRMGIQKHWKLRTHEISEL